MSERLIQISVELSPEEALAFAQFLKRAGHSDYLRFTEKDNSEEAYLILYTADKLRSALTAAGFAPR